MTSSKVVPGLKGFRDRISSWPQRPPCIVLHTMQGDLWKRGLKWNATSALGCTLLPQVKSTWNLEKTQDIGAGSEAEPSNLQQQQQGSGTGTTNLSAPAGTEPWMTTISPGARPPRMVPLKGTDYGGQTDNGLRTPDICSLSSIRIMWFTRTRQQTSGRTTTENKQPLQERQRFLNSCGLVSG